MNTEYTSIKELADQFEEFWVPHKVWDLGVSQSAFRAQGLIDLKSKRIYLEKFDPITDSPRVLAFDQGNYPDTWVIDEDGTIEEKLVIPK